MKKPRWKLQSPRFTCKCGRKFHLVYKGSWLMKVDKDEIPEGQNPERELQLGIAREDIDEDS